MTREQAIELIRQSDLQKHADNIIRHLMPSVRLIVQDESISKSNESAHSHFGGLPSFSKEVSWPLWDRREYFAGEITRSETIFKNNPKAAFYRDQAIKMRKDLNSGPVPLAFLGQLSLKEIHAVAQLPGWPSDGILAFFYDLSLEPWGFDPLSRGYCRVRFLPAQQQRTPRPAPKELSEKAIFPKRILDIRREWTLPNHLKSKGDSLGKWETEAYINLCLQLMPESSEQQSIHRCGGHPQEIQDDMRLECQLVTNGLYCGNSTGYQDPRRPMLEKGAADWQLLLQIDTDDRLGWMWGDMGRIYFWIRRQELENADFDGAWAVLQCG